eukprot:scaffold8.g1715.t1
MAERPAVKKQKVEAAAPAAANVIIQFRSPEGEATGPELDVPHDVTPQQLEALLNGLLQARAGCARLSACNSAAVNEEKLPYSFYIEELELAGELGTHLAKQKVSVEAVLRVVYQPQAVFRVRPVARCSATIPGHTEAILSVNFSPDGKRLCSGSGDATVRFWDLNTQLPAHTCKGHGAWVLAVAWSPDAALVASGDHAGAVWLWDPKTGARLGAGLDSSPDWSRSGFTGKPAGQCRGHRKFVTSLAWEPAHVELPVRRFCSGSKDATIRVWEASTRRCLFTMSNHTAAVKWGGDGLIYSAARDCSINVWDASDGKLVRSLRGHGHWVNTMSLSTDYALRTGAFDHTGAAPADPAEAKAKALQRYEAARGGRPERLATGSDDFTLFLWEPSASKQPLARMTGHMQLINQARARDRVTFSPDGRWIASASFDKSVKLWDGVKGAFVATLRGHVGPVYQVAWSADSRLFVSGSKDSTLKIWEVRTRKMLVELPGHADEVFSADWAPDGGSVASGGKDRALKLWRR